MALDNLLVLDGRGRPYDDRRQRGRLVKAVEAAPLADEAPPLPSRQAPPAQHAPSKSRHRSRSPSAHPPERRSSKSTRATARRYWPLSPRAIHRCGHTIHSAHIATYGERAVDVFYLTAPGGTKLERRGDRGLRAQLLQAAREPSRAKPPS